MAPVFDPEMVPCGWTWRYGISIAQTRKSEGRSGMEHKTMDMTLPGLRIHCNLSRERGKRDEAAHITELCSTPQEIHDTATFMSCHTL
jgi:hypothetical protein